MDGLEKMIQLRGGLLTLKNSLRNKIFRFAIPLHHLRKLIPLTSHRADLAGCIGTLSAPRFATFILAPTPTLTQPSIPSFAHITEITTLDNELLQILSSIQSLTTLLNAPSPNLQETDYTIATLQYSLLSIYSTFATPSFQLACCIAALAFLRTIHHYHRVLKIGSFIANHLADGALIRKLRECVEMVDNDEGQLRDFVLWMLFMGGILVNGKRKERAWFVAKLGRIRLEMGIERWEEAKKKLMGFFWVEVVHEKIGREMWEEAGVVGSVFSG